MNRRILILILNVVALIFLQACGGAPTSQPGPAATVQPGPATPAMQPAAQSTAQATLQPTPTLTPKPTSTPPPPTAAPQASRAENAVKAFQAAGLPIVDVVVYTAETDPNKLLGRPHQYIAKVSWKDTRLTTPSVASPGGSIEVFANTEDLQARKQYVESFSAIFPEYSYVNGLMLFHLSSDLTPDQAKVYEDVFMKLR